MVDTVLGDITGKKKKNYDPFEGNTDLSATDPTAVVPATPKVLPKGMGVMATLAFNKSNAQVTGTGTMGIGTMGVGLKTKAKATAKATSDAEDAIAKAEDTNVNIRKELGLDTILSNKKRARDKTTKLTALGA